MNKLRLRFGHPEHGWLPVELRVGAVTMRFNASYTPYDFVASLVEALACVLAADGTCVARMNEEPLESEWVFQRNQDTVVFSIVQPESRAHTPAEGKKLVEVTGPLVSIVLPFWRGFQELRSRDLDDDYSAKWGADFPSGALDRLTQQIEQLKREAPR